MAENPSRHEPRSACALANGLELIGDRWTMLIIRDLMFTNKNEFGHLLSSGEGISTNILTERLSRLQAYNVLDKLPHPSHGKKSIYQLTEQGLGLAPVLIELTLWSYSAISETFIPPVILDMMVNDREALYEKVRNREPIFSFDL